MTSTDAAAPDRPAAPDGQTGRSGQAGPTRQTGRRVGLGAVLRGPWSASGWLATVHVLVGFPICVTAFVLMVTLVSLTAGLAITAILAVVPLLLLLASVRVLGTVQRSRFAALLDVRIDPVPPRRDGSSWWRRLVAEALAASTWRQIGYHLVSLLTGTVGFALVTSVWSAGLVGVTAFAYGWVLPRHGIFGWDMRAPLMLAALTGVGLVVLFAAPWVARGVAAVDVALAWALLGPSRGERLRGRVASLTESRAGAVDAADAERRRIERDLHDGTQQRLVSLAMNLGMARAKFTDAPEPARDAIAAAHEEAKQALVELRGFVRGLHPAVLNDRGLDAALSGIAARAPLPVSLRVEVSRRPSPTIEAVAYFVVSEALNNVVKHAEASRADVTVRRLDGLLRVEVADDGRGGAGPDGGSGLRGLAQRVASVDGTLRIDSPPGVGTVIVVELPCES
ncbi:MAG TPA: sensor domain-containing protein [Mycobacteriales bacterium]|nr:sensor domain-containing protein [Mycobacteriales bacterium]